MPGYPTLRSVCPYRWHHHLPRRRGVRRKELLYLLGDLMNPANKDQVLAADPDRPKESADYFRVLDEFIVQRWVNRVVVTCYRIIIDDAAEVARQMKKSDAAGKRTS